MLAEGTEVGRYRVESLLGAGGMGEVYCAYDSVLRRRVALKILRRDLPDAGARLLREARAAAALSHPGAVSLFDVGEIDGLSFIAMELVAGVPLRTYVGDPSVSLSRRLRWLSDIARVLAVAHQKGFVHRDIKPENVMVGPNDAIKVLDFGIAKQTGSETASTREDPTTSGPASYQTEEGKVTGTPRYMAPEQLRGDALDGRTDQYAWGAMAYELISGSHPRPRGAAPSTPDMLNSRVPEVPFEIAALVARALAPTPELRFPDMDEIAAILEAATGASGTISSKLEARTSGSSSTQRSQATIVAGTRRLARVRGTSEPTTWRFVYPALALLAVAAGTASVIVKPSRNLAFAGFVAFAVGLAYLYLRPLFSLRRALRVAELVFGNGTLAIVRAGRWNRIVSQVTGASIAPLGDTTSVLLATTKDGAPMLLDVAERAEALAILSTFGLTDVPFGRLRFSLGRGPREWAGVVLGIAWRIAWPCGPLLTSRGWAGLAVVVAIAVSALAIAHAFLPRSGPFLELAADGVHVGGSRRLQAFFRREDLTAVGTDTEGLFFELRDGTVTKIPVARASVWAGGPTSEELARIVAHVEELASIGRTESMESMLTADDVEGGNRGELDTRRTA